MIITVPDWLVITVLLAVIAMPLLVGLVEWLASLLPGND